jgi:ABC-2 type transport system permease protein
MAKFLTLLQKEVRELLTWQLILPMIITLVLFGGIGKILTREAEKNEKPQPITVLDLDQSAISANLTRTLAGANFAVDKRTEGTADQLISQITSESTTSVLVVPRDFSASVDRGEPLPLETYTVVKSFSLAGVRSTMTLQAALQAVNDYLSTQLLSQATYDPTAGQAGKSTEQIQKLKNPLVSKDILVVNGRQAPGNISDIMNYLTRQTFFIPIILMLVIILSAQMIATSMALEKENKTLETLLSLPVSRRMIVSSKLAGAGVVSLLFAGVYLIGMRMYMEGITQTTLSGPGIPEGAMAAANESIASTVTALGLQFTPTGYALLGATLFFGILSALAIAMILGAFVEDVKGVQGVISPLMVLILIPYLLTMLLDYSTLSAGVKYLVLAIPFSHPFLATQFLPLQQYGPVLWGILYQIVTVVVFIFIAAWLFSSDKILTLKFATKKRPGLPRFSWLKR